MKTIATLSNAIRNYVSKKATLDALEKEVKEEKKVIEDFMTAAGEMTVNYFMENGEVFALKLSEIERTNVNAKQLQENYPAVYDDVTYMTAYNRLTVKAESELKTDSAPVEVKSKKIKAELAEVGARHKPAGWHSK